MDSVGQQEPLTRYDSMTMPGLPRPSHTHTHQYPQYDRQHSIPYIAFLCPLQQRFMAPVMVLVLFSIPIQSTTLKPVAQRPPWLNP
jgi:hypothetical protein